MIDSMTRASVALFIPSAMFAKSFEIAAEMGYMGTGRFIMALNNLGGPLGITGGMSVLLLAVFLGDKVISFGLEELLVAIYGIHRYNGLTSSRVRAEVNRLWLSYEMRRRILDRIGC